MRTKISENIGRGFLCLFLAMFFLGPTAVLAEDVPAPYALRVSYDSAKTEVNLIWKKAGNADYYEIYRRENKDKAYWFTVGTSNTESYNDFYFAGSTAYVYKIKACVADSCSGFSDTASITTDSFVPNVTGTEEQIIEDEKKTIAIRFPGQASAEPLLVVIDRVSLAGVSFPSGFVAMREGYRIRIKNKEGAEVREISSQAKITVKYTQADLTVLDSETKKRLGTVDENTITLFKVEDGKNVPAQSALSTSLKKVDTLTGTPGTYYLIGRKTATSQIVIRASLIALGVLALLGAGYFLYRRYVVSKEQKEHSEDYIYRH